MMAFSVLLLTACVNLTSCDLLAFPGPVHFMTAT